MIVTRRTAFVINFNYFCPCWLLLDLFFNHIIYLKGFFRRLQNVFADVIQSIVRPRSSLGQK